MLNSLPSPIIFAHRGASLRAPENTLAAFVLAKAEGADAIELDVKLSADGIPVVMHDPTVDRTTDGSGAVATLGLPALKELDAGDGQRIPTLEEIFEEMGKNFLINIELSNYTTPNDSLVDEVVDLVEKHQRSETVLFSSFLAKNLKRAEALLPQTPRGLLALPNFFGWWVRNLVFRLDDYQALHPHFHNVSARSVARVHKMNRRVHVWTLNQEENIRKFAEMGVDGIFTDDPRSAHQLLRSTKKE